MQRAAIVIGPMGIGEVLDGAFTLAKRNYRGLLLVTAWAGVPSYLAFGLAGVAGQASRSSFMALSAILMILWAIGVALMVVATAIACARLIEPGVTAGSPAEAQPLDPAEVYGRALSRLLPLFLFAVVIIAVGIPLLILVPVGVFVFGRWAVSYAVICLEPVGPIESLRRSWHMTRGAWWHTTLTVVAGTLITGIVSFVLASVISAVAGIITGLTGSQALGTFLTLLANGIPSLVVQPFSAAIMVVLYYELRARSEGFDLTQRVSQLATV